MNKPSFIHRPQQYGLSTYALPVKSADTDIGVKSGRNVYRGPTQIVLLLTEPFALAGRSVQFPISSVIEEKVVSN